jgi:hypothetical protein
MFETFIEYDLRIYDNKGSTISDLIANILS